MGARRLQQMHSRRHFVYMHKALPTMKHGRLGQRTAQLMSALCRHIGDE